MNFTFYHLFRSALKTATRCLGFPPNYLLTARSSSPAPRRTTIRHSVKVIAKPLDVDVAAAAMVVVLAFAIAVVVDYVLDVVAILVVVVTSRQSRIKN